MKVAVSIPDELFERVDRLARDSAKSRSAVYAEALTAYVQVRDPDEITRAIDAALDQIDQTEEVEFARAASARTLRNVEW